MRFEQMHKNKYNITSTHSLYTNHIGITNTNAINHSCAKDVQTLTI